VRDRGGNSLNPAEILGIPNEEGVYVVDENNKANERTDSEPQEWSREAVEWAVANGIIFGDGAGNLMLREPCTREQVLVFLHRMYQAMQGGGYGKRKMVHTVFEDYHAVVFDGNVSVVVVCGRPRADDC
jgi:hypothetical protein